ncbi:MAG: hypothetical protein JNK60_10120 [Acidobacteria bacterium]|nr:hypothetical protein [Acidobacteriota bacterium]
MKIPAVLVTSLLLAAPLRSETQPTRVDLEARLAPADPGTAPLYGVLTPLFLDHLERTVSKDRLAELWKATDRNAFLALLEKVTGRDLLETGERMFEALEKDAVRAPAPPGDWVNSEAGPFTLHMRPDSAAQRDLALIEKDATETWTRVAALLDLSEAVDASHRLLAGDGRIDVYLHAARAGEGKDRLGHGHGGTSLGGTIVDGKGRLTTRIDVLYLNAFSLAVLEHEVAHAVVLLAAFDAAAFAKHALEDKAGLKTAFLAAYRKVPAFLHEGLGDYALYHHGLQKSWGLLPEPRKILTSLRASGKTLPLEELLAGDVRFRAKNHKVFSLEAAAFLDFLLATRGKELVRRWLFSGEPNGAKSFAKVFGTGIDALEKEFWSR